MSEYRLPDYSFTDDFDKFDKAWKELYEPFVKMGFEIHGFDPGIMMSLDGGQTFTITVSAAKRINENLR